MVRFSGILQMEDSPPLSMCYSDRRNVHVAVHPLRVPRTMICVCHSARGALPDAVVQRPCVTRACSLLMYGTRHQAT
jgi:hypothetical protein